LRQGNRGTLRLVADSYHQGVDLLFGFRLQPIDDQAQPPQQVQVTLR
jgi:hypothetical protein